MQKESSIFPIMIKDHYMQNQLEYLKRVWFSA